MVNAASALSNSFACCVHCPFQHFLFAYYHLHMKYCKVQPERIVYMCVIKRNEKNVYSDSSVCE